MVGVEECNGVGWYRLKLDELGVVAGVCGRDVTSAFVDDAGCPLKT